MPEENWIDKRKTPPDVRALWPVCYEAVQKTVVADHSDVKEVVLELSYQLAIILAVRNLAIQCADGVRVPQINHVKALKTAS